MYKSANPYRPIETEVIDTVTETPTIRTLKLEPKEELLFETGQFIELTNQSSVFRPVARISTDVKEFVGFTIRNGGSRHPDSVVICWFWIGVLPHSKKEFDAPGGIARVIVALGRTDGLEFGHLHAQIA